MASGNLTEEAFKSSTSRKSGSYTDSKVSAGCITLIECKQNGELK
jgi:hypothetical protein